MKICCGLGLPRETKQGGRGATAGGGKIMITSLGKPLHKKSTVQTVFVQIAFQPPPPPLKQTDALWELFSPKICQFLKTAVLTLEMDILTITMVKLCS